eukprot:2659787-Pyramimonas_sp.AAC.2
MAGCSHRCSSRDSFARAMCGLCVHNTLPLNACNKHNRIVSVQVHLENKAKAMELVACGVFQRRQYDFKS